MDNLSPLGLDDLLALVRHNIARRLDASSSEDHRRAGDDLLVALDELERRGCSPYPVHDSGMKRRSMA